MSFPESSASNTYASQARQHVKTKSGNSMREATLCNGMIPGEKHEVVLVEV